MVSRWARIRRVISVLLRQSTHAPSPPAATASSGRDQWVDDQPQLLWLVIPGKAKWLKEFFTVQMMVTNLADPCFVLDHGIATLPLPPGLSLAPTATPQSHRHDARHPWRPERDRELAGPRRHRGLLHLDHLLRRHPRTIRRTITLDAKTQTDLHVWGGSAPPDSVDADDKAYDRYPYHVTRRAEECRRHPRLQRLARAADPGQAATTSTSPANNSSTSRTPSAQGRR